MKYAVTSCSTIFCIKSPARDSRQPPKVKRVMSASAARESAHMPPHSYFVTFKQEVRVVALAALAISSTTTDTVHDVVTHLVLEECPRR